ncbi:VCBS domain-containing protein, partial [Mesorhizobium kowhaii]|uniref:VCBS domain-containing protein n=1 Tax=Mesorhizobium kowhaii TaxID=1300272 RepID=UPI001ABF3CE2
MTDTFIYSIRLGNGTLSWATATIQFAGTNDGPVLSNTSDPTAVLELTSASAQNLAAITGNFSVSDLDIGNTLHASVVGSPVVQLNGSPFSLPAGAAALIASGAFTLTDTTSNGGAANIGYSYDPTAANLDFLRAGQSLTITYTVQVNDGTTNSGTQNVTFTITGTNDAPVLSDTSDPAAVLEAVNASAQDLVAITGNFSVSDLDIGDTLHASVVGSPVVQLNGSPFSLPAGAAALIASGAFTLTDTTSNGGAANIGYSYDPTAANLDFLRAGQNLTITYTVQVNDGTTNSGTQNVTFTIHGTNDAAVIGDPTVADVTEDSSPTTLTATGSISITDVDTGENHFNTTVTPGAGNLGALVLAADGSYTYSVANAAVQFLAGSTANGGTATQVDTFTVTAADGTSKLVSFTIHGTNDAAVIGDPTVADVTEDSSPTTLTATGSISITDVDTGENHFNTTVTPGAGNLGALVLAADGSYTYSVANA